MVKKLFFVMSIVVVGSTSAMFRNRSATIFSETLGASDRGVARSRRRSATICPEVYKLVAANIESGTSGELIYRVIAEDDAARTVGLFHLRPINGVVTELYNIQACASTYYDVVLEQALAWAQMWCYRQVQFVPDYLNRSANPAALIKSVKAHGFKLGEKSRFIKNLYRS